MNLVKDQELGLSLSLNFNDKTTTNSTNTSNPLHLNLMSSSPSPFTNKIWTDLFPSSDRSSEPCRGETRSFLKGIDVNRLAAEEEEEEEEDVGISSPNSTISSISGKKTERENSGSDDLDIDRASSRGISDEEEAENARKKLRLSKDQSAILEETFKEHNTLNPKQKQALAKRLGLRARQVEVWFQNRRARTKLKQTEVDCEFLKRCCEKMTEENRRLQKELQELRALKLSPNFYMQMNPPTTLTMCPSCERVAAPPSVAGQRQVPIASSAHPQFNPWAVTHRHRQFDGLQRS